MGQQPKLVLVVLPSLELILLWRRHRDLNIYFLFQKLDLIVLFLQLLISFPLLLTVFEIFGFLEVRQKRTNVHNAITTTNRNQSRKGNRNINLHVCVMGRPSLSLGTAFQYILSLGESSVNNPSLGTLLLKP